MVLISDHLNLSSQVQRSPLTLGSGVKPQQPARMYHGMFLCNASHHRRHCQEHDRKEMNLLHYVHHKYTGKYQWLRVGNCKELFSLGDTCQQSSFTSSVGFPLDRLQLFSIFHRCLPFQLRRQFCLPCLFVRRLSLKSKSSREKKGKVML